MIYSNRDAMYLSYMHGNCYILNIKCFREQWAVHIFYKKLSIKIKTKFFICVRKSKLANDMLCMFLLYFGKTTVEKRTEVVHLMFFGSLKLFAYIIKMHLIILPRVDTTTSCWLIFLCHVSESIVSYVLQENKLH